RARRGAPEGARALRLASRRSDAPHNRARQPRGRARTDAAPHRRPRGRRPRGRGRVGRDLRLDDAAPEASTGACAREARPRAPASRRDEGSDAGAARGRGGGARSLPGARGMKLAERRLDPAIFDLPVEKMRAGWYTDAYFNHTRAALLEDGRHPQVVM